METPGLEMSLSGLSGYFLRNIRVVHLTSTPGHPRSGSADQLAEIRLIEES